jgi:hypothetical protein
MSFEQLTTADGAVLHWVCDEGCGASAEFDGDSFHPAWAELKGQGWTAARDRNGEWVHRCPKCQRPAMSVKQWLNRT